MAFGVPTKVNTASSPSQTGLTVVKLVKLGSGVTTTVALFVNAILQPLRFKLVKLRLTSTIAPVTVIIPLPVASIFKVNGAPPFTV